MKRLKRINDPAIADNAGAVLLPCAFSDGTREDIEVLRTDMRPVLTLLLQCCAALGEKLPTIRPITATGPADGVLVPTEEFRAVPQPNGSMWLIFRVGSEDLVFALPDPRSARALAEALLAATGARE